MNPIDEILMRAKSPSGVTNEEDAGKLADEVLRLREYEQRAFAQEAEMNRQAGREAVLRSMIARVEALLRRDHQHTVTGGDGREYGCIWPEDLHEALKGPT